MKRVVLVLVTIVLFTIVLTSCNESICPAYVMENQDVVTEDNG